ncbi:hypothetical protein G6K91_22205 [Agrobacterium rhizogenes]|nr:hypothetical protein [Rhizobium rhizogenes]NTG56184.1 hypothetical protein [Rhizobium rhizogenes]NTH01856.1 hypothetical protein [Rhizobium rhizogenes]NTH55353.1 hypothetical protein [Rhizobium rhizogenes]NTH74934.1 hypothetical protein [Rhizobium rhizogenes]
MINAFAFRLRPSHIDKVEALLAENQIAIGWSKAEGLLTPGFSKEDFRKEVAHHYPDIVERNWVGQDVNHLWRFIREMKNGDIVVIPHDDDVHFVQVTSEAMYFANQANDDTAIRRDVVPLLGGKPINRASLPSALRKSLGFRNTSKELSAVLDEVLATVNLKTRDASSELFAVESAVEIFAAIQPWWHAFKEVGTPYPGLKKDYLWVEELNIWLHVGGKEQVGTYRHKNSLGNMPVSGSAPNEIVRVNPPESDKVGRWQGLIAKATTGETWLLHSGEMKLTSKVLQLKDEVLDGQLESLLVRFRDGTTKRYFPVARLDVRPWDIVRQTKRFMDICQQIRVLREEANPAVYDVLRKASLLEESIGHSILPPQDAKEIDRLHAKIWHGLRKALEKKNFKVSNRRVGSLGPDLFTIEHKPPYLFEIKTGAGASDYLKGVGQLSVYQKALGEKYRKFLVIPQGLDSYAAQILQQLEIEVIEFSGEDPDYVFSWPKHF